MFTGPSASVAQSYVAWLRASGATRQTVYLRSYYLRRLMRAHDARDLPTLTRDERTVFLGDKTWKPETRKSARSTVAGFYRWTADERLLGENPARRLPPVRIPLGVPRPAPDTVLADAPCQSQHRDRLMLMFAAYADCRSLRLPASASRTSSVTHRGCAARAAGNRSCRFTRCCSRRSPPRP